MHTFRRFLELIARFSRLPAPLPRLKYSDECVQLARMRFVGRFRQWLRVAVLSGGVSVTRRRCRRIIDAGRVGCGHAIVGGGTVRMRRILRRCHARRGSRCIGRA